MRLRIVLSACWAQSEKEDREIGSWWCVGGCALEFTRRLQKVATPVRVMVI